MLPASAGLTLQFHRSLRLGTEHRLPGSSLLTKPPGAQARGRDKSTC